MLADGESAERIRPRTEMVVLIGKVGLGADHTNLELTAAPAFADTRVENGGLLARVRAQDRKSTRLNSSHDQISYAVFCLKKKKKKNTILLLKKKKKTTKKH